MKSIKYKILLISIICLSLTACNGDLFDTPEPDHALNPANQNNSNSEKTTNSTGSTDSNNKIEVENTTAKVGGIQIQGPIDIKSLQENSKTISSESNNGSSGIVTGKRGIAVTPDKFSPDQLEVPVGVELLIYNASNSDIQIVSTNKECNDFDHKPIIKKSETITMIFKEAKICSITDNLNSKITATITVK